MVHLGLGAFSRSHTAWYTAHAGDADEWGIAAYTGRSGHLAAALESQGGVYTLVERSAEGDRTERIESVVRARPGDDLASLIADVAAEPTAVVTLTITEAGYRAHGDGELDLGDPLVAGDLEQLRSLDGEDQLASIAVETVLGRLVVALEARRRAHGSPIALVSCDNIPDNGEYLRRVLLALAAVSPPTAEWCGDSVAFVSTSVDRITPRISEEEQQELAVMHGDRAPVVAEPFHDWVLSGAFPRGRPRWESAGARFTDELAPWEARKLWLLNGAHTLLACLGPARGHADVATAIADPVCRAAVDAFWDEAAQHLADDLEVPAYRAALLERFANPRIRHRLSQIAIDTTTKLRLRVAPVAERERAAGRSARGCALVVAAWMLDERVTGTVREQVRAISTVLADDAAFVAAVTQAASELEDVTFR